MKNMGITPMMPAAKPRRVPLSVFSMTILNL
jgi:hypothetical protein